MTRYFEFLEKGFSYDQVEELLQRVIGECLYW